MKPPTRHYPTDNRLEEVIFRIQFLGLRNDFALSAAFGQAAGAAGSDTPDAASDTPMAGWIA